jgi:hypothetical protein
MKHIKLFEDFIGEGKTSAVYTDPNTGKKYDLQYVSTKKRWELDIMKKGASIYSSAITTIKRDTLAEIQEWLDGYKIDSSWTKGLSESIINESKVSEANFKKFDDLKFAIRHHEDGNPYYDKIKLINIYNGLKSSDQQKAKKQYGEYFGVSEVIDTEYWATYNTDTTINVNKKFAEKSNNFDKTFKEAVANWNSEAEDDENKLPPAQAPKIKKLANEYFKKEGWISINIIQAMISQETF